MSAYATEMYERYQALDRLLVSKGWHATSPWWLAQVKRYFESGCRQLVARVGRRGGKSSTLCRIASVEGWYGRHQIPPGDVGVIAFISVSRDEASQRLRTIKAIHEAIGCKYKPIDGGIELLRRPVAFKTFAATLGAVIGFTAICVICDEVSKWKDSDTGANPATEVLASVRPTMASQPNAKIILSSSPLGKLDAHATAFDEGDNDFQFTAFAPTWLANPTISEAETHRLEKDAARWRREYGAVPIEGSAESLFSTVLLDRSTRPALGDVAREPGVYYVGAQDPALSRNSWTFAIAGKRWVAGRIRRSVVCVREWTGQPDAPLDPFRVLGEIATLCRRYDVPQVYTDIHHGTSLQAIAQRPEIDLPLYILPSTQSTNVGRYENLLTYALDDELELPPDEQVRSDLLCIRRVVTAGGLSIRLDSVGARHADYCPSIALACDRATIDPAIAPPITTTAEPTGHANYPYRAPQRAVDESDELEAAGEKRLARKKHIEQTGAWWEQSLDKGGLGLDSEDD